MYTSSQAEECMNAGIIISRISVECHALVLSQVFFFPSWSCIFVQARPSPVSAIENTMARAALRSARSCDGGVGILLYTPYSYGYIFTYNPNSTPQAGSKNGDLTSNK